MAKKRIRVGRDHVQQLIIASPLKAIEELIWNGLDAGGLGVEVRFFGGAGLGAIDRLDVVDKGSGIHPDDLPIAFGTIGESQKAKKK